MPYHNAVGIYWCTLRYEHSSRVNAGTSAMIHGPISSLADAHLHLADPPLLVSCVQESLAEASRAPEVDLRRCCPTYFSCQPHNMCYPTTAKH